MTHALKTWPEYYGPLATGDKTFELRKDDRPFEVGDTLIVQEFDPKGDGYSGKELKFSITAILRDAPNFGLKKGFCILSIKEQKREDEY